MNPTNSYQLLTGLLERQTPTEAQVDTIIQTLADENQYVEYKDGRQPREDLRRTVRRWTTGFANADGGVLVLGISEPDKAKSEPRKVVGITVPGGGSAAEWATDVLRPFFPLPPRIALVKHREGDVLFIAAERAPELLSYAEANEPRYALRVGHSTVDIPPYLLADLLLGRRNHPVLNLRQVELESEVDLRNPTMPLRIAIEVENLSFIKATETEIWTVAWSVEWEPTPPNSLLLQSLDVESPLTPVATANRMQGRKWMLLHSRVTNFPTTIRPFSVVSGAVHVAELPFEPAAGGVTFALYTMPEGSMPGWYEISTRYALHQDEGVNRLVGKPKWERLTTRRPRITWYS